MTTPNPFLEYLEEEPRAAYFSYQDQFGKGGQRKYYENEYSDIYNEYLGRLGSQARSGQAPSLRFNEMLSGLNFNERFRQESQQDRGEAGRRSQFSPALRWFGQR
jgi:hypothetical protein